MAHLGRKLALLAAAAEAARRYAQKNPDKAGKLLDQAAGFVDKQTKGKYSGHIDGVARKAKVVAGIPTAPGYGPAGQPSAGFTPSPAPSPGPRPAPNSSTPHPATNPGSPAPGA